MVSKSQWKLKGARAARMVVASGASSAVQVRNLFLSSWSAMKMQRLLLMAETVWMWKSMKCTCESVMTREWQLRQMFRMFSSRIDSENSLTRYSVICGTAICAFTLACCTSRISLLTSSNPLSSSSPFTAKYFDSSPTLTWFTTMYLMRSATASSDKLPSATPSSSRSLLPQRSRALKSERYPLQYLRRSKSSSLLRSLLAASLRRCVRRRARVATKARAQLRTSLSSLTTSFSKLRATSQPTCDSRWSSSVKPRTFMMRMQLLRFREGLKPSRRQINRSSPSSTPFAPIRNSASPQLQYTERFLISIFFRSSRVSQGCSFDLSTNTFSLLGPTVKTSIDSRLQPKLYPCFSGPASFSSKRRWKLLTERQRLSSILQESRSMRPDFSLTSAFSFALYTSSSPTCFIVLFINQSIALARSSPFIPSLPNQHKTSTDSIVITKGLPKRFFHGILRLSPLMQECLIAIGRLYFWRMFFFNLRFFMSILPDHIPTLSSLESISSMNSPRIYFKIFYKYFSNISESFAMLLQWFPRDYNNLEISRGTLPKISLILRFQKQPTTARQILTYPTDQTINN